MAHTPGPWMAFIKGDTIAVHHNGTPDVVKWGGFDDSHRSLTEHAANALLIAAAPELLEAAQAGMQALAITEGESPDQYESDAHRMLREAIAHAT